MAIIACHYCGIELDIPLPDEGGPEFGAPIRCPDCGNEFSIMPPQEQAYAEQAYAEQAYAEQAYAEQAYAEQIVAESARTPPSYSEAMFEEQIAAADAAQAAYAEGIAPSQCRCPLCQFRAGALSLAKSVSVFTLMFATLMVVFVAGWQLGDALFGLFGAVLRAIF